LYGFLHKIGVAFTHGKHVFNFPRNLPITVHDHTASSKATGVYG